MPGGFELEVHVADEIRSRAVSASLLKVCMAGWLRAGQLSGLCMVCGLQCVLVEVDLKLWLVVRLIWLVSIVSD